MDRVAVFVDAGYLFAQGSVALAGSKQSRSLMELSEEAVVAELKAVADASTSRLQLLRIYWYDGAFGGAPNAQHGRLAHLDDVKVRLGVLNSAGEQKGVDSLIVTDLIDLSRNRSICDAVLLSGDEDIRVGVQVAQTYGVRVHLLGIVPARGSQSRALQQEADTVSEWDRETVARFLAVRSTEQPAGLTPASSHATAADTRASRSADTVATVDETFEVVAQERLARLSITDLEQLAQHTQSQPGLPREHDGPLLAIARIRLGRDLDATEKRRLRSRFLALLRNKKATP